MEWLKHFWKIHGERIVFMSIAVLFGLFFWYFMPDMKGEAKTILIGVAMLCYNKARGNGKDTDKPNIELK